MIYFQNLQTNEIFKFENENAIDPAFYNEELYKKLTSKEITKIEEEAEFKKYQDHIYNLVSIEYFKINTIKLSNNIQITLNILDKDSSTGKNLLDNLNYLMVSAGATYNTNFLLQDFLSKKMIRVVSVNMIFLNILQTIIKGIFDINKVNFEILLIKIKDAKTKEEINELISKIFTYQDNELTIKEVNKVKYRQEIFYQEMSELLKLSNKLINENKIITEIDIDLDKMADHIASWGEEEMTAFVPAKEEVQSFKTWYQEIQKTKTESGKYNLLTYI